MAIIEKFSSKSTSISFNVSRDNFDTKTQIPHQNIYQQQPAQESYA